MSDLDELYQEVILDHNRRPRNFRVLESGRKLEGYNPLCGDRITVYVDTDGDVIREVTFQGAGCAISQASASVMTTVLQGMKFADAEALFGKFQDMVTGKAGADPAALGELAVLAGVQEFPTRVKCATLAWHTLRSLIEGRDKPASTERTDHV
jgi:nitrogen fixation NifU-like protein